MQIEGTLILDQHHDTLLYAKAVNVNITDWFFFKENIVLKYIGLDDAIIKLKRTNAVWNYQFLMDYFSSPDKKTDTSKNVIQLDLKTVVFNNVKLDQQDKWTGEDQILSFNRLRLDAEAFDMKNKKIQIRSLDIDKPLFAQLDYNGLEPAHPSISSSASPTPKGMLKWNEEHWQLFIKKINITNGNLAIEQYTKRPVLTTLFDDQHILFSSLNATFNNVSFKEDTLLADINLKAINRSGFEIKKLTAAFKFTPDIMEFKKLDIYTNKSHITDYYSMGYKDFNKDMNNFDSNVVLKGNFKNSIINSDDIAYFAPELKNWKRVFDVTGLVTGVLDDLTSNQININTNKTSFSGGANMKGVSDINKTFFNIRAQHLATSINDLSVFVPGIRSITEPNISALGNIGFKGTFTGLISNFTTNGILTTGLGTINQNLTMKIPVKGIPVYSGTLSAADFYIGKFLNQPDIGKITFTGKVAGSGFENNALALKVDGNIKSIGINNYTYQNITANGTLKHRSFMGTAMINDPNMDVPMASGSIDFSKKFPEFKMNALINNINFKELQLSNDNLSIKGKFDVNFSGNTLDNFIGYAKVFDATLLDKNKKLSFDSLVVKNFIEDNKKHLSIQTNELDLGITGNFQLAQLSDAFQIFLNKYYPSYIPKARLHPAPQDFTFSIKTHNVDEYTALIDKRFKGFNNSTISGNLRFPDNQLNVVANIPSFSYKNTTFNNVDLKAVGGTDTLSLNTSVEETSINDSLKFPNTRINVRAFNDISDISIKASANQALNEADLSVRMQTLSDGFNLFFNPSSFVINNKKWVLEKGGTLSLNKDLFTASEVKFIQDNQQLIISTTPSRNGANDISLDIKSLNIGDLTPFFIKTLRLEGLMTGKILVTDPFTDPMASFDTQISQFRFENDSVGVVSTIGIYSTKDKKLSGKLISDNQLFNLSSELMMNFNDSVSDQMNVTTILNNSEIHPLEKYLTGLFTNVHGLANGRITISGGFKQPKVDGSVRLSKTSFIVDYTKAKYLLAENSVMNFNGDVMVFPKIILRDTLNNVASVSGKIFHKFFNDFVFEDLSFVTDHFPNGQPGKFLLLNTTSRDNKDFYGHLVGDAHLSLNGPDDDMNMYITGEPTDSSHIYLPTGETAETGKIDYIDFIKFGREMKSNYTFKKASNIKVTMDINANPYAKIDVILDEVTGDIIKAQGTGKLNISVGSRDPLIMRGRYDILQGLYTFNFQTFFKTPFVLQQGYIEWQGDPYLANMNIDAIYKARQVDMSGIVTSNGVTNTKGDIDILFKLRGTLKEPKPDFEFQFAFDNPLKSDPIANEYIRTKFQGDRNTLNKEVTALLLFNSIINDQQNLLSGNNTGNFVTRSLGQVISNTLSGSLNNILKKVLKTDAVNLYTNINTADFNFQNSQKTVQNVGNFGLRTAFLKNRLLLNLGGNVDYNLQRLSNSNSNFLFTPDVSFEYYITPDGKFRVVGFNRIDASLGDVSGITRRNRTGLLLSYHKDFNTFNELFGVNDKSGTKKP